MTALAEERDNRVFRSVGRTHRQADLFAYGYICGTGQENAANRSIQDLSLRIDLQDPALGLILGPPFGSLADQGIQAVGQPFQVDVHDFAGSGFPGTDNRFVLRYQLIRDRNVNLIPVGVVHLHLHTGGFAGGDVFGRGRAPAADIADRFVVVLLLHRHELAFGAVLHGQGDGNVVTDIHAGPEFLHLAGGVGHGDLRIEPTGFHCREDEGESAVGSGLNILFQDNAVPMVHLDGQVGSGQAMPGETLDLAFDHDFVALQIQFVVGVEGKREGGKDELIHAERVVCQVLLPGFDYDMEIAVPLAFGKGERAGNRAVGIGLQLQAIDFLVLFVEQDNFQRLVRHHGDTVHEVALIDHSLELEDIAGIVCPTVLVDVAVNAVGTVAIVAVVIIGMGHHLPACPQVRSGARFGRQGVIDVPAAPDGLLELLRKQCEAVQTDGLGEDNLVRFPQGEFRFLERLAGNIVRHIGGVSVGFPADRQRERMLVVMRKAVQFPVHGFQRVGAVAQDRKIHLHRVIDIETAVRIDNVPCLDCLVVFPKRQGGLVQVAEEHAGFFVNKPDLYVLGCQGIRQPLHTLATFGDLRFIAFQCPTFLLVGQALVIQRLVGGLSGLLLVQVIEIHPEQFLTRPEGDRLPGILPGQGLQRFPADILIGDPDRHIIGQITLAGILPGHFLLQSPVNLVFLRIFKATGTNQVPQHILIVGSNEVRHRTAHEATDTPVQRRVVSGPEGIDPVPHEAPALVRRGVSIVTHP